jgi:uncharacterized protein (DUF4415 family)
MKTPSFDAAVKRGGVALGDLDEATRNRIAAAALPDDRIDVSDHDAPEVHDGAGAVRGRFGGPVKDLHGVRIDGGLPAYLGSQGPGHQGRIDSARRDFVLKPSHPAQRERT